MNPPRANHLLRLSRRSLLQSAVAGLVGAPLVPGLPAARARAAEPESAEKGKPSEFQIACMTLPYSQFPLARALEGIRQAGYRYVAWGTTHKDEGGRNVPVVAADAAPERAKELAGRCRDMGLEPLMMFSMIYPENDDAVKVLTIRIRQAAAAKIPQVLTFGHTEGGKAELWVARFKELAPVAKDHGVMIVVKQHGGSTGTGESCAKIVREVNHESIAVNYDAGNVMDYLNVDPLPDLAKCTDVVHSFCIKDHRNWPRDEDCGPGFGEIDHYRLLHQVAFLKRKVPLCCENIFAPLLPRPADPGGVDVLAKRAREYLETVTAGLQQK
jgi:sugar phosphate isomerase/epimerase